MKRFRISADSEVKAWVYQCNETTGSHTAVHSEMFVVFMKGYKMLCLPQSLHFYYKMNVDSKSQAVDHESL